MCCCCWCCYNVSYFFIFSLASRSKNIAASVSIVMGILFHVQNTYTKLKNLSEDMTFGPDSVPPTALSYFFNRSLKKLKFPTFWKSSFISPIHKKVIKMIFTDLQPNYPLFIKFLSVSKMSLNKVCKYVVSNNQHGFVRNNSTTIN